MFGAILMHFIYYINRSIAPKVDSTYLGYWSTAHIVYVLVWRPVGANQRHRDLSRPLNRLRCRQDLRIIHSGCKKTNL